ncbi:MAG TPA: hypothetical protein VIM77_11375, partial [Mucilaginibacter sp.]
LHMLDYVESYGYSSKLMESLTGEKIKPLINVGAIGLSSQAINWHEVERWVKELEAREGKTYYLEQAITAMIIGNAPAIPLPAREYVVNPKSTATCVLHHYVDLSKEYYYKLAWRQFI